MIKKILIFVVIFSAISIPVLWKLNHTYSIYVDGENQFLSKALTQKEEFESGDLELSKEQLMNMYIITAKAEPSRYGMRQYHKMNIMLFLGGFIAFIVGWYFGFKEGKKG